LPLTTGSVRLYELVKMESNAFEIGVAMVSGSFVLTDTRPGRRRSGRRR
jgi:hypothetical protein